MNQCNSGGRRVAQPAICRAIGAWRSWTILSAGDQAPATCRRGVPVDARHRGHGDRAFLGGQRVACARGAASRRRGGGRHARRADRGDRAARAAAVEELGSRSWTALAAFLRGQGLVALFDAFFIGLALVIVATPLVLPLVVLTFFGAFIPIIGAFAAGAAAVLVALVFSRHHRGADRAAAIVVVQQIESNVFAPVIVGRSVHVHPLAILLAVTIGIIGALVAGPLLAVGLTVLVYLRERADEQRRPGDLQGAAGSDATSASTMRPGPHAVSTSAGGELLHDNPASKERHHGRRPKT
jgi:hypothetical protein